MSERTPRDLSVLLDDDGKAWLPCNLDGEYSARAAKRIRECAAAWEADRARIATLEAKLAATQEALGEWDADIGRVTEQRDALVPLAKAWLLQDEPWGYPNDEQERAARAALAAVDAERETTTEEDK